MIALTVGILELRKRYYYNNVLAHFPHPAIIFSPRLSCYKALSFHQPSIKQSRWHYDRSGCGPDMGQG